MRQTVIPLTRSQRLRLKLYDMKRTAAQGWQSAAFAVFLGLIGALVLAQSAACESVDAFCVIQAVAK